MQVKTTLLMVLVLLIMTSSAVASGIIITIAPEVVVKGPLLTLGEIAEVTGDDEPRVQMLKALRLGSAPKPGSRSMLTRELLGGRLSAAGADFTGITWSVPEAIVISTQSQLVSGQMLADTAIAAIKKRLHTAEDKIEIELAGISTDISAPVGEIELRAELPYGIRKGGPTIVSVLVASDGRLYDKVILKYNVRVFEDIVVAARPIAPHEALTADNLVYQRTDTARLSAGYVTDIGRLTGLAAKRAIAPGTIVTEILVAKPVIVKRGSNVVISARSGGIEITATGQALQDGTEGQIIRVQNVSSKRIVAAKVTGEGQVRIITIK